MRYGNPSVESRLEALQRSGCDRILLFPLYPQYSAATTATACDKAFDALKTMRWQPAIRVVPPYYDDPAYIEALASSTRAGLAALDFEPEVVIASFHGLPQAYFDKGDPYYCHCAKTARLLREALGWPEQRLLLTFQSRFGRAEWLKPYTAQTIAELAQERRQAACRHHAGFRRGLHRDAGGDGDPRRRDLPRAWRRALRHPPLPQRFRAKHRRPFFHCRTRVARLGGWLTCIIARAPLRAPGKCDTVRA